jgi:hypothetical protein
MPITRVVTQRLDCGHQVDMHAGVRLWCHYDFSFGVLTELGTGSDPWHDFEMDGSPYKARGSRGYYNASRLACEHCGLNDLSRRRSNRLVLRDDSWELHRPSGDAA